ncbi:MAG TPA: Gfo/Idh/MocA family oxidoreductase [Candidatus Krumholzibacteria bacterium]|nr:Gfo/Idh/MocA family oxidoreductase [Candidatus Krumholzibacteria bacterium]
MGIGSAADTFRIGVIGAGSHGARYLRHAAADVPGMAAVALCRRDPAAAAALAGALGVRAHADPQALIADPDVDGVIIVTPPSSHFALAAAVLAAGKPLLLEKPMTGTLDEAVRLAALDAAAEHPLMLAQSLRWNPVIAQVRALWPRLGRVHLVRAAQRLAPTTLAWQRDPAVTVGGSVLLTGVHIFDTVRHLTGCEFVEIDSRQRRVQNPAVEDLFLARGRLDDGCWVDMEVSKYTRSRACWLEAVGEDGQLWADYLQGGIVLRTGGDEERFDVSAAVPTLPPLLADWLAVVRGGTAPPVGATDGVATLKVAEACYRSDAAGAPVPC